MWSENIEEIHIVLDSSQIFQMIGWWMELSNYGGRTHVVPESTLREKIMRAMCDFTFGREFWVLV
jgi:hypothetical protein